MILMGEAVRNGLHVLVCLVCALGCTSNVHGQLFPGLEGEALVQAIQDAYTPSQLLTDAQVKDTLYTKVFNDQDSVHCIYSNLAKYLPEGADPSQWLFGNGNEVNSINLEHSWPQSKGAGKGTMGNRNMHHLYPSRTAINSDRADFPYNEISDPGTQKWYYLGIEQANIPVTNIDAYSEFKATVFEPREAVKGDLARALMYFWTIYRDDALQADPDFFELQRSTLCAWHEEDPVDVAEQLRSQIIATYQSGEENPFVLDCSLANRAYCPELTSCFVATRPPIEERFQVVVYTDTDYLIIQFDRPAMLTVIIMNLMGQVVRRVTCMPDSTISYAGLTNGIYLVHVYAENEQFTDKVFLY